MKSTDKIKAALRKKKPKDLTVTDDRLLSTGSVGGNPRNPTLGVT